MAQSPHGGYEASPHPSAQPQVSLAVRGNAGTFTVTVKVPGASFTTPAQASGVTAAALRTAINTAIGAGVGISCTAASGGPNDATGSTPYLLTFDLLPELVVGVGSLTGGTPTSGYTFSVISQGPNGQNYNATDLTLPASSLNTSVYSGTVRNNSVSPKYPTT